MEKAEKFEFIDKTFFALSGTFGNGRNSSTVLAEKSDNDIRFSMVDAVENNSFGLCSLRCHVTVIRIREYLW